MGNIHVKLYEISISGIGDVVHLCSSTVIKTAF